MASKTTETAVDAYLAANWTDTAIYVENETGDIPSDASAFIVVQYPVSNVDRVTVNQPLYREEGAFRIVINVQRGAGTDTIRQVGEDLATLFRDQDIGSGVRCFYPSEPFTDDQSDRGLYFSGSMIVPFERYFSD
jgi:hypothetical protein